MSLTLIEQSKLARDRDELLKATTMELFAYHSDLLYYLPFSNSIAYILAGEIGLIDKLIISGCDIDTDIELVKKDKDIYDEHSRRVIKETAKRITKELINGNIEDNPKTLNGLRVRCIDDQLINNDTGVLSLNKLDELIDAVDNPTHLLMNKKIMEYMVDTNIFITYSTDYFGRKVTKYTGIPILISGEDDKYEEILSFTESDSSGTQQCTSIYCLSLAQNGLVGIQNGDMEVRYIGKLNTKPIYRTRIEWYITLATIRPRSIARLCYIEDGSIII